VIKLSNKVVLRQLKRLIEEAKIYHKIFDTSRLHENHPLVNFIERRLSRRFSIAGGLQHCPELEKKIEEAKRNNPEELRRLIYRLIEEYYQPLKLPFQRVEPQPWVLQKKKKKKEVIPVIV